MRKPRNKAADRLRAIHVYIREPADERYLADLDAALATERRNVVAAAKLRMGATGVISIIEAHRILDELEGEDR